MTLAELRDKADAKLATFWSALVAKQDTYYAKHNKYFQLLVSPVDDVDNGADSTFTVRSPSDEKYAVSIDTKWSDTIQFNIRVDEWVGADKGYTATAQIKLPNGDRYTRSRNSKNEDSGWTKIIPSIYG